jgi:cell division protein FtsN
MARDYGNKRSSPQKGGVPQQFLVIIVTFVLGYLTASFFDVATIGQWLNNQVLAQHDGKQASAAKTETPQAQAQPKPKFEFYTLLANEKGTTQPAAANHAATTPATTAAVKTTQTQSTPTATGTAAVTTAANNSVKPRVDIKPTTVKVAEGKPLAPAPAAGKSNYSVQVAAFKARQDAEHMKGLLILKGFDVAVVPVTNARGNWFRVVVGPYPNRVLAQKAQVSLAKNEHLRGMVTGG